MIGEKSEMEGGSGHLQWCSPVEFSAMMEMFATSLSDPVATCHVWVLNT